MATVRLSEKVLGTGENWSECCLHILKDQEAKGRKVERLVKKEITGLSHWKAVVSIWQNAEKTIEKSRFGRGKLSYTTIGSPKIKCYMW